MFTWASPASEAGLSLGYFWSVIMSQSFGQNTKWLTKYLGVQIFYGSVDFKVRNEGNKEKTIKITDLDFWGLKSRTM